MVKGQVLFHLDPRPYQGGVRSGASRRSRATRRRLAYALSEQDARTAASRQAGHRHERAGRADARHGGRDGGARCKPTQATLDNAKFNLDNTVVRAPISGRTGGLLVRTGNLVHAAGGTPLVVINQVRPILVRFAVPASELPMILKYGERTGKAVALPVTAIPGGTPAVATAADTTNPMDATDGGRALPRSA